MHYPAMAALAVTLMAGSAAAQGPQSGCTVFRILPDGRKVRSSADEVSGLDAWVSGGNAGAASASSGASQSSVSISSSSSAGSNGSARAVSSYTDEKGRKVTITRNQKGCTVVIDERDGQGEKQ